VVVEVLLPQVKVVQFLQMQPMVVQEQQHQLVQVQ
jgi:hypothetical protein